MADRHNEKQHTWHGGGRNPFLPLSVYIPDGEPKVFGDRVYLYGSKDEFGGEYCSHKYHVYSAPVDDLETWTDHGAILASTDEYLAEGIGDGVPWSDGLLWAPDVAKKGDTYYLYFCLSDGSEGVAESPRPEGPFTHARRITMGGKPIEGIDPSVLEVNGSYYYTWGQGKCHMARLMDDMCTLDPESYIEALISNEEGREGFHEGSSLRRIGDWYCLVYASEYTIRFPNRRGTPTCLDYAVSKEVSGPYERRGTIIDNTGIDPRSWNNHGSIIRIGEDWFVFYHGSSNNSEYARRARVERIRVDEESGTIARAEMTSSGFARSLPIGETVDAACAYRLWGGAYCTEKAGKFPLVHVKDGNAAAFRYIDFGETRRDVNLTLRGTCLQGGEIAVCAYGREMARVPVCQSGPFEETVLLPGVQGRTELNVVFHGREDQEILELDSIRLSETA